MSYIRTTETIAKLKESAKRSHQRNGMVLFCIVCLTEFYAWPARVNKARCCSMKCSAIHRRTDEFREDRRIQSLGERSHFWKGGITPLNKIDRESSEGVNWRKAVKARDNFTCQMCGSRGGELHSDHIIPFAIAPKLRWILENGRTLCKECHYKTPTFGGRVRSYHELSPLTGRRKQTVT